MTRRDALALLGSAGLGALLPATSSGAPTLGMRFIDVTARAGLTFRHNNGAYGGKLLPETLGAGCAFLDYDADGWQDILLVNGCDWPGHRRRRCASGSRPTRGWSISSSSPAGSSERHGSLAMPKCSW